MSLVDIYFCSFVGGMCAKNFVRNAVAPRQVFAVHFEIQIFCERDNRLAKDAIRQHVVWKKRYPVS